MKKRVLLLSLFIALCSLHVLTTHALTGDTLDTFKVVATSTITPRVSTNILNLPYLGSGTNCVHSVSGTLQTVSGDCNSGGGGGGGITTGTVATLGSPLTIGGTQSSTISGNNTTSSISYLNGTRYLNPGFETLGCFGSPTTTEFGACINLAYKQAFQSGVPTAATIRVNFTPASSNWTSKILFDSSSTTNGQYVVPSLQCNPGVRLVYNGTGTAVTFNFGNPTGHLVSDDYGCAYMGHSSLIAAGQTNTATTTGILFGGVNGAVGINFHDNSVNGFGRQLEIGSNAYMPSFFNLALSGGNGGNVLGSCVFINVASNSGERNVFDRVNCTDPGNSTTSNAVYISSGGTASNFWTNSSFDDAQVYCGASDGQCVFNQNHWENSAYATYGRYIPFINPSSDRSTMITFNGNSIANDTSGANGFDTIIKHGGQLVAIGNILNNYGGGTPTNFVDHSNDNGVESELICETQVQGGGLTNIIAGGGNVTYSLANGAACWTDVANSYPIAMVPSQSNVNSFFSGNVAVATNDHSGNWSLGADANSHLTINGSASTTGNVQIGGSLFAADGTKYSTSTVSGGGGGGVATTTPFTAGYLPYTGASLALTNSAIYQATNNTSTYDTIAFDAVSNATVVSTTSVDIPHTISAGNNRILFTFAVTTAASSTATYNGVAMTLVGSQFEANDSRWISLFVLPAPATGTHNVTVTTPTSSALIRVMSASYTGASQTTALDASTVSHNDASVASFTTSLTTTVPGDWAVLAARQTGGVNPGGIIAGASSTFRVNDTFDAVADVGPITPAGTASMTVTASSTGTGGFYTIMAAFAPATLTSSTQLNLTLGTSTQSSTVTVAGKLAVAGPITGSSSLAVTGTIQQSITNAIALLDSIGKITAYAGSSCASGVVSSISATGTVLCVATSTGLSSYNVTSANAFISVATTTTSAALTFSSSSLALGTAAQRSTGDFLASTTVVNTPSSTIYGAGAYLAAVGSQLTASSTLASTTVAFTFQNATATKPYSFANIFTNTAKTISYVDCYEYAAATTTMMLYYNTTNASTGVQQVILPSISCGIGGASTNSFTTTTLPINAYLFAIVSSTVGTPTQTVLNVSALKL